MKTVYFISHPEVVIDPTVPVPQWSLSEKGRGRMRQLLTQPWVETITSVYSSTERKAVEGAAILAEHLGLPVQHREALGENDRSSTGFLPSQEFEAVADQFFAHPESSVRGWETALQAQQRIVDAVNTVIKHDTTAGSLAIVSHGGVGTLLLCYIAGHPIHRAYDQPGQGNYYVFTADDRTLIQGWRPIDVMREGE
jgi:broad specificity phosphatase PhoE